MELNVVVTFGFILLLQQNLMTYVLSQNSQYEGCIGSFSLIVLLDSSVSLRDADPIDQPLMTWMQMTNFTQSLITAFPTDKNINVGVVRYSSQPDVVQPLVGLSPNSGPTGLGTLPYVGGNTDTADALNTAMTMLTADLANKDRQSLVLLITDGLDNVNANESVKVAQTLKVAGAQIYALGVTNYIDSIGLSAVASTPTSTYFLQASMFGQMYSALDPLVRQMCGLPPPTVPPTPPCSTLLGCLTCVDNPKACDICEPGYYLLGATCKSCPPDCQSCVNDASCVQCNFGYYLSSQTQACTPCTLRVDLAFLVDTSGSIRDKNPPNHAYDNFAIILQFITALLDQIEIGYNATNVAEITFSNTGVTYFRLNDHVNTSRSDLYKVINSSPYEGGFTNTSGALRLLHTDVFLPQNGDRPDAPNVAIIITDGQSNRDANETIPEANKDRSLGTTIFAVGVTNLIDIDELNAVASTPTTEYVFTGPEIQTIKSLLQQLTSSLCGH